MDRVGGEHRFVSGDKSMLNLDRFQKSRDRFIARISGTLAGRPRGQGTQYISCSYSDQRKILKVKPRNCENRREIAVPPMMDWTDRRRR
jgi:hypothetical protein